MVFTLVGMQKDPLSGDVLSSSTRTGYTILSLYIGRSEGGERSGSRA